MDSGPFTYRRRLPHLRLDGSVYFVTWRVKAGAPEMSSEERNIVMSTLLHFDRQRYVLHAFVIMNDHVHVVFYPLGDHTVQKTMHSWKTFSSNEVRRVTGRQGGLWQEEYLDRIIRDEDEYWEKLQYIMDNPLKRWPEEVSYKWVMWFKDAMEASFPVNKSDAPSSE